MVLLQHMGCKGHPGEETEEGWRSPGNGQVGPLTLRFYSQVSTHLLESYFQLPAQHKPFNNLGGSNVEVGTQQRLWPKLTQGITDQDPTNGHRGFALVIPDCAVGGDLQRAVGAVIPVPLRYSKGSLDGRGVLLAWASAGP